MSEKTQELAKTEVKGNVLTSVSEFPKWMEVASALSKSSIVPKIYQNNPSNCLVALEMSGRMNVSPLVVMQNLDIIQGKPSWSASFIIGAINSSGRFKPLRFVFSGDPGTERYGCRAVTEDMEGKTVEGTLVDWKMVKGEGWLDKSGSKWKTMPDQMFRYRSASFFGRVYAPDVLIGMQSTEEVLDVIGTAVESVDVDELQALYNEVREYLKEDEDARMEDIIRTKEKDSYGKAMSFLQNVKENIQIEENEEN
jgi:hypothetical protein